MKMLQKTTFHLIILVFFSLSYAACNNDPMNDPCASGSEECMLCGNGELDPGEACDDGNIIDDDACSNDCTINESCGDGILQTNKGEECDPAIPAEDSDYKGPCDSMCTLIVENPVCGNGLLEAGEECDDGNTTSNDGCSSTCNEEIENPICGDGSLDAGEECDDGNSQDGDGCSAICTIEPKPVCGNGIQEQREECDDNNLIENDGCNQNCQLTRVIQISTGADHSCALLNSGDVKCWGDNRWGQLGYGNTNDIGDNEVPSSVGIVELGAKVQQISAGASHTCALLDTNKIRCWGKNNFGQLGINSTENIGDNELPLNSPDAMLGNLEFQYVDAGDRVTCAISMENDLYCWGKNGDGQLGLNSTAHIGDNETPLSAGPVKLGALNGHVMHVAVGADHICIAADSGDVKCWGKTDSGALGYGSLFDGAIGDDEEPSSLGFVNTGLPGAIEKVTAGFNYTCALDNLGNVKCWGFGNFGQLGYGTDLSGNLGDDELPSALSGGVSVGGAVLQISAGSTHVCAILESNNSVSCWGANFSGQLGRNSTEGIGDDETPSDAGPSFITQSDIPIIEVSNAQGSSDVQNLGSHSCAIMGGDNEGKVSCWGQNKYGQLGYGNIEVIGDDEFPYTAGNVELW